MKNKLFAKIVAGLLAILMVVGLLPLIASAEETDSGTSEGGTTSSAEDHLHLNKNAKLQPDGTWTITLEAYATGEVQRVVKTQVVPTDIILVLDQSGSMDNQQYYIDISSGTYSAVSANDLPTNEQMVSGTYYFWDANDQKYYPITTTRRIVKEDTYWAYSKDFGEHKAGDLVCLTSEADGKVATSWTYNGIATNFEEGKGYLLSDYRLYQRERTGYGSNRSYNYKLVAMGTDVEDTLGSNAFETGVKDANTAYQNLAAKFPAYQTDSVNRWGTVYGLVYVPVEMVNNDVYYYTYTYVDDMGQTWTIGHSEQDDGAAENIADAKYDTALGNIYVENISKGPRLTALKNAATNFINDMKNAAAAHAVDHRIAVVGFSGNDGTGNEEDDYEYINSELFIGANQYNYYDAADGEPASGYYAQAFQSVGTTNGYNNLIASIGALEGNGPTYTSVGFNLAAGIAAANAGESNVYTSGSRKLVVVFMTDGEPGWNGYESGEASTTVNLANSLKSTYNATVYTVALLSSTPTDNGNIDNFLNNVTSDGVTGTDNNKYTLATDGVSLTNFFSTIEISVDTSYSTVELSENAFLVDRVSEYFEMPAGITKDNIKNYVSIYTADHLGNNEFSNWTPQDYAVAASVDAENTLDANKIHAWLTLDATNTYVRGITVHNFDYLSNDNMVTTQYWGFIDANDNDVYDEGEELIPMEEAAKLEDPHYTMITSGKKIIVEIRGITAKDSAALDYYIDTNNEHSGLWDLAEDNNTYGMLKAFPMPHAMVVNRVYVLDYAKEACLDTIDNTRNALALDSAKDGIMSPVAYTAGENGNVYSNTELRTTDGSGAVEFGDAYIKTEGGRSKVYYTPKTTNWYGYDSFYVLWHAGNSYDESTGNLVFSDGDPSTGYGWSKVNVMPANNVYYEDTFVTTSTDGTTSTGTVGIKFGDGWSFTYEDENGNPAQGDQPVEGDNTELPESAELGGNDTHGWVDSLADDTGFSDGTAAVGNGREKATATFTFTGTGVDIYSYTDSTVGTILVKVEPIDVRAGYKVPTRYFIVDNYSASGNYYQIPTVSYSARGKVLDENGVATEEEALVYGKYKVTITVTTAAIEDNNRVTYYLDGIRVYNPLGSEQENNPTVSDGYGTEVHSFFYNIREYLIDQNDFLANSQSAGAVFIDEIKKDQTEDGTEVGEGVTTSTIGTYEDYGPKNEVYLAPGQQIVTKVDIVDGRHWYVSLKTPTGQATSALISNGSTNATVQIGHTSDLYYEVIPTADASDPTIGYISIQNTGDALLAVTKYQITGLDPNPADDYTGDGTEDGGNTDSGVETASILPISDQEALTFSARFAAMPVVGYNAAPETGDTTPDVETPEKPEAPDVEIVVPEQPSLEEQLMEQIAKLVSELFDSIRNWFIS